MRGEEVGGDKCFTSRQQQQQQQQQRLPQEKQQLQQQCLCATLIQYEKTQLFLSNGEIEII